MWSAILISLCVIQSAIGAPLPEAPSKTTIGFMKKYGYLLDAPGPESDTLYTEEGFKAVVKQMQKFGGLNETGEMTEETMKLMETPRCGVPDVISTDIHKSNRTKRYIVASDGWRKRQLTYFLSNWGDELGPEQLMPLLEKAFKVWSDITPLNFTHIRSMDADVIIAFGRGHHGDRYAFDGPGNTLAHAFFPNQHGSYAGDIHFDDDEIWSDESNMKTKDGVDFFTVATHEIGHSLGLAHSTTQTSVMFPYYKGYDENFRIDYDDVLGMYDLYVRNQQFEDNAQDDHVSRDRINTEVDRKPVQPERPKVTPIPRIPVIIPPATTSTTTRPSSTTTTTTKQPQTNRPYVPRRKPSNRTPTDKPKTSSTRKPNTRRPTQQDENMRGTPNSGNRTIVPDICKGPIQAIATLRTELFIFHKEYMWRMKDRGITVPGFPAPLRQFFVGLPKSIKQIDAIYQRPNDYYIIIFTGNQFWTFTGNKFTSDSPQPLSALGLPQDLKQIDAAMVWAKNKKTYLFSGEKYWRYDDHTKTMEQDYPKDIESRWQGIPTHLDSAFTWTDGQTYFFKDLQYWRFNNEAVTSDENFPRNSVQDWLGCHI